MDIVEITGKSNTHRAALPSHASFGIILPSGDLLGGNHTRHEVKVALVFMPHGSRIHPPIPEANPVALNVLDALCDSLPNAIAQASADTKPTTKEKNL